MSLISGCANDTNDIDRRGIVVGLGLDAAPGKKVTATAQFPTIDSPSLSFFGQTPQKPFINFSIQDEDAYEAVQGIESKSTRSLFLGQLKIILVHSDLAELGLVKYTEWLARHPEIPPLAYIALTQTTAKDIISATLANKFIPALAMNTFFELQAKTNKVYPIELWQFIKGIELKPTDAYLPIISYDAQDQAYSIHGIGVFHRDRLVGYLSDNQTRMAGIVMGKTSNASFMVPNGRLGKLTYRRVTATSKIAIVRVGPNIEFLVTIKAKGYLPSITSDQTALKAKDIQEIENATASFLKAGIRGALNYLQKLNSDIIGFGDIIRANKPEVWEGLNWETEYPHVNFKVKVKFTLERAGKYY